MKRKDMADEAKGRQDPTGTEAAANMVDLAFHSPVPRLYFNGFAVAYGASDVTLVLQLNGTPIGLLHTSYPIAKTLGDNLTAGIGQVEKVAGVTFPSNEELTQKMQEVQEGSKK